VSGRGECLLEFKGKDLCVRAGGQSKIFLFQQIISRHQICCYDLLAANPVIIRKMKILNTRQVSLIHIGGFRPTGNPLASNFGLTPMALPDEKWPTFQGPHSESKSLFYICQINLTEAPYVPELLSDIKLITLFVHPDFVDKHFCIRAYKSLDKLVPLPVPQGATFEKGFEARYELAEDQPHYDDPDLILPKNLANPSQEYDQTIEQFKNQYCSKIGGYASSIQSAPFSDIHPAKPKFCLQIDSEAKIGLMWGDSGSFYIARGTAPGFEDQWFAECQFY
jgi:hypothetical protein